VSTSRAGRRFLKNRGAIAGCAMILVLLIFAAFGPMMSSHDPYTSDFVHGVMGSSGVPVGPNAEFLLGIDRIFRDEFARLALGARLSLVIAFAATALATVIGAAVGILAGYYEGSEGLRIPWSVVLGVVGALFGLTSGHLALTWTALGVGAAGTAIGVVAGIRSLRAGPSLNLDTALMRLVDVGLSFPFLLLVMAIGAAVDRTTVTSILVVLGLTGWLGTARILRAKTLQVRHLEYITAARALGLRTPAILFRHVLPNVAGPLIVIATASVAQMIVAESVLSYLGVGISPPTPTWGHMLFEGQDYYAAAPWLVAAPAGAILLAVFGFNLVGEGLRDALDAKEI
jgi:ABC-type dipeptide/oligopeptide/nickel transport system permease subunit